MVDWPYFLCYIIQLFVLSIYTRSVDMELINFCFKYPAVPLVVVFLVVIVIVTFKRTVIYNGKWETTKGNAYTYTDRATGSTFLSPSRIIGVNMLGSRRKKFGKPVWSLTLTLFWLAVAAVFSCFFFLSWLDIRHQIKNLPTGRFWIL